MSSTITQGLCQSFLLELASGIHDFTSDQFMLALYDNTAVLSPSVTTAYSTSHEVTGSGYVAGGRSLVVTATYPKIGSDGKLLIFFDDVTWNSVTISARAAVAYNLSKANRAVAVIDFGSLQSATSQAFEVIWDSLASPQWAIRIGA
jgi:hypothetical protein